MRSLIDFLERQGVDAYMIYADSICNADLFYASRFLSHDSFLYLHGREKELLLVSDMEAGRARQQARVDDVVPLSRYNFLKMVKEGMPPDAAYLKVVVALLQESGVKRIAVPQGFGVHMSDSLRSQGIKVVPVKSPLHETRAVKSESEVSCIRAAQEAAERAIEKVERVLRGSMVKNNALWFEGEHLTSERLRSLIEVSLLMEGYSADSTIVACGSQSADPHNTGTGVLESGEPIVIDVFPQHKVNRYRGDVSRTFVHGTPQRELLEMYEAVLAAQEKALGMIRPGISGSEVHAAVCEVFESLGYSVGVREGFVHSTGHGVGLEVHERPRIGVKGEGLQVGNVITVEPGLYYQDIGGVRIEDLVVVSKKGCVNLNTYHKQLIVEGTG